MASEHSFDISASIDKQEIKNALEQAKKELENRYDLKGITCEFELNEKESIFTLHSSSEAKLDVVHYMSDWDLHCSYAAHIELNDDVYQFVPEFSIYLSWKILPDLKIDQEWQYNTTTETWER